MSGPIGIRFETKLLAPTERIWEWITSVEGISAEMRPFFRMTTPKQMRSLADVRVQPGTRMFRSYVFLFGFLPIDYSDMTLVQLNPGVGFVEQSPMGSMKLWRHERYIALCTSESEAILLVDQITFQPRMARGLVDWFILRVFTHRHKVLRENLNGI